MKIRLFFQLQIFVCLMWQVSYRQSLLDSSVILSPDGIFDLVSDRYNNQYALSNLQIGTGKPINGGNTTSSISGTCNAGYFKLHFEAGSIFDQIPSAQNLIYQVYSDISNFINSNAPAGSINIQCRNTLTSSDLGRASSFFVYPSVTNTINCNILDGQVYKYLVSGSDPYIGVPGTFINAGNFYHGYVEANPFLTNTITAITNSAITSPTYILNPGGISQNVPSFVVTPTAQTIYTLTTIGSGTLDSSDLKTLAELCPGTNGPVIYQAKSLFNTIYGKILNSDCSESGEKQANVSTMNSNISKNWEFNIYPNPTDNSLNVSTKLETEVLSVSIVDLSGRKVFSGNLKTKDFIGKLDFDLINGAYFITIRNSNEESITKKLLISK